ncbi:hypothetical protein AAGS40_00275 [Paraburkholderia sp. PREW-6R]|uniref:hypothetical protein n=1 Tax=Paraburkholderia sp. PREW-6R TaxID=3141544 RepID=UPI0031F509B7
MSVICALRNPAHASQDALTGLPASSFMSLSTLQYVTSALADAMLAGGPESDALVRRMTFVVGASAEWMVPLAKQIAKRFGARWDRVERQQLSRIVAESAGFVAAWRGDDPPRAVRLLKLPPAQKPAPPWLHGAVLPNLPTPGDVANWLELDAAELDWFADRWRVPAGDANAPVHHYVYKVVEKRDGRCRLIEMPKSLCVACSERCCMACSTRSRRTNPCMASGVAAAR